MTAANDLLLVGILFMLGINNFLVSVLIDYARKWNRRAE